MHIISLGRLTKIKLRHDNSGVRLLDFHLYYLSYNNLRHSGIMAEISDYRIVIYVCQTKGKIIEISSMKYPLFLPWLHSYFSKINKTNFYDHKI
jgi:hypothetical protein